MPKVYRDQNVLEAAQERFEIIFQEFDHVYLSVSGGKDSSVMLQLAAAVARQLGRTFDVLFIDMEAQYQATIGHLEELREATQDVVGEFYWVCLPLSLRNAVSVIQPKWICWDLADKKKWVRPMPKKVIHEGKMPKGWETWFSHGMEFEDFILEFAQWYSEKKGGRTAAGIGIRTNESLNRFRSIISEKKQRFQGYGWTTRVRIGTHWTDVYNFYPIYDWEVEDIWGAVSRLDLLFNPVYEWMYKNGLSLHEQRLCQPYGDDQRNGLDQFRAIEPETWEKVLNRVHGVNFGNIYARSSLLGNIQSEKPDSMTWEQYAVFLLESLGLYAPELRDHYVGKIRTFFRWYEEKEGIKREDIKQEEDRKLESAKKVASWRRIARAIERNDFWMKRLSFSQTKRDVERIQELKKKYHNLIYAADTNDKHLKQIADSLNGGSDVEFHTFEGEYDSREFYALMGPFFAERNYRKQMPYLVNEEGRVWIVATEKEKVVGFTSYIVKRTKIEFGYTYSAKEAELEAKLNQKREEKVASIRKPIEAFTMSGDEEAWLKAGFQITKETKNYTFLRKDVNEDE